MQSDQLVVVDQLLCAMGPVVMVIHDLSIVKQPWWRLGILSSLRNLHIDWIPMSSGFYCPFFSCHPSSILITSVFCLFKHTSLANPQLQALGCQSPAHWSLVIGCRQPLFTEKLGPCPDVLVICASDPRYYLLLGGCSNFPTFGVQKASKLPY